ncbi:hypothetical protein GCM10023169_38280 [Georgenia halophila]|uniref:Uncharacterized protein n=1 Tax=Georgenia halophila TaxID=620889 RepID=A0ABP8LP43_9MICO
MSEPTSAPGQGTPSGGSSPRGGSSAGSTPGRPSKKDKTEPASTGRQKGNPVAWTALLVAVVLTVWQAIYSLTVVGTDSDQETFTSVSLFITLVLGLAATVLGIVSIAQRRSPRWPGLAGLSVGLYAFIIAVFSWIGGLMNTGGV